MMKTLKLLLVIPLLVLAGALSAATITISGKVTDNGSAKSNVMVYWTDSLTNNTDSALTNASGNYSITLNVGTATQGQVIGRVVGCNGRAVYSNFFFSPRTTTYTGRDFVYCSSGGGAVPYTATITGLVSNISGGPVSIYADTLGGVFTFWNATATATSTSPTYSLSLTVYNASQDVWVWMVDCKNDTIVKKIRLIAGSGSANNVHFNYCSTSGSRNVISGNVKTGSMSALYATVLLIEKSNGSLKAVDSTNVQRGYYSFVNPDTTKEYLVKAFLLPTDSLYRSYLPTYSTASLRWSAANAVPVGAGAHTRDINMVAGTNNGGPGFIGGKVSQGANKSNAVGDPIAGVQVMLLQNGNAVAYTFSDADGKFEFSNLAYGTYDVDVDRLGLPTTTTQVTISANKPKETQVLASINNSGVTIHVGATGLLSPVNKNALVIYPNPVKSNLTVNFGEVIESATISVYDVTGSLINSTEINAQSNAVISFEDVKQGSYIIKVETEKGTQVSRIIKH